MAKRLSNNFTDAQGQAWSIQLFDSLYAGSTAPFSTVYGSPRLSWNGDPDETHAVTLPSKLSLEIVRTTQAVEDYLAAVPAREEGQLLVKVYKGTDLEWIGVVLPETLSVPLDDLNGVASLEAVDALGLLSRLDYKDTDGTAFTGWEALTGHLLKILAKLPTWSHYASSDVVLYVADHLRPQQADGDQPANFYTYRTRVEHETFYEVDDDGNTTWMKCADVLAQIATVMGARLIHAAGAFYFVPSLAYLASDTPALYGFQKDGTGDTTFPNLPAVVTVDSGGLEDGWAIRHAPPVRAVFRSQEYLGNLALFRDPLHTDAEFGTTVTATTGFSYPTGTVFTVTGTLRITLTQNSSLTGSDQLVRWLLVVILQIPGEQVGGTRTFVAMPADPSAPYDTQGVTWGSSQGDSAGIFNATATPTGSWEASPTSGHGYGIWTPPMVASTYPEDPNVLVMPFTFTTSETVTDGQNLSLRCLATGWTGFNNGSVNTATDADSFTYETNATFEVENLRVILGEAGEDNGNTVRYGQQVGSASGLIEELELLPAIMGDQLTPNTRGRLQTYDGSTWANTDGWTSPLTTTAQKVNKLLCKERLHLRGQVLTTLAGTVHELAYFSPLSLLRYDADSWLQTAQTRTLDLATTEVEAYRIQDLAPTVEDTDDDGAVTPGGVGPVGPVSDPPDTNDPDGAGPVGTTQVNQTKNQVSTATIGSDVADIQGKTDAITVNASGEITDLTVASGSKPLAVGEVSGAASTTALASTNQRVQDIERKTDNITTNASHQITAIATTADAIHAGSIQETTSRQFVTSAEADQITTNQTNISTLSTSVDAIISVVKDTTGGGGKGVYNDTTAGTSESYLGMTATTARLQAGAGNTGVDLSETSPGTATIQVQAGAIGSEAAFDAVTVTGSSSSVTATTTLAGDVSFTGTTSGVDYGDLDNTPSLAAVATSGSYSDLSGTPTIPADFADLGDVNPSLSPVAGDLLIWTTVNGGQWSSTTPALAIGSAIDAGNLGNVSEGSGTSGNILVDFALGGGAYWITQTPTQWAGSHLPLGSLSNVSSTTPTAGDLLRWSGTQWQPYTPKSYTTIQSSFYTGDANGDYIPIGGTLTETTSSQYYNRWTAPTSGRVVSARIFCTAATAGASTLALSKYPIPSTTDTASGTLSTANTDVEFAFSSAATFSAGDQLRFWFDPTGVPGGVSITLLLELDHP